jgi:hypothetical protein
LATPSRIYLSSSARKKVTAGKELSVAAATVAEVYLRLTWYIFKLNVILQETHPKMGNI